MRGNNYLLDGIPITDANNRAIIIPTLESVQEVKIQANTYDAEMARTGGGMFNTLMKSGTNDYHGSAYGHVRRTDWDANAFFSNAAGIPITNQPNTTWGASFGGPVSIPKIYNGKNRTFFFLGIEHYDDASSDSADFNLPTLAERTGDFSKSFDAERPTACHLRPAHRRSIPGQHHTGLADHTGRPGYRQHLPGSDHDSGILWRQRYRSSHLRSKRAPFNTPPSSMRTLPPGGA